MPERTRLPEQTPASSEKSRERRRTPSSVHLENFTSNQFGNKSSSERTEPWIMCPAKCSNYWGLKTTTEMLRRKQGACFRGQQKATAVGCNLWRCFTWTRNQAKPLMSSTNTGDTTRVSVSCAPAKGWWPNCIGKNEHLTFIKAHRDPSGIVRWSHLICFICYNFVKVVEITAHHYRTYLLFIIAVLIVRILFYWRTEWV